MSGLSVARICEGLRTHQLGRPLHVHATVGSTNDLALDMAARGATHGTLVVADRQTSGRGRRSRAWASPGGLGLYASLVVRGSERLEQTTLLVAAVGLGIAEGLEAETGIVADIKWPNDVWSQSRKVAGVLVEARGFRPDAPAMVAGFGINVGQGPDDFPPDLRETATSLRLLTGAAPDRVAILCTVLQALEPRIEQALRGGAHDLERAYRDRSCLRGCEVELLDGDRPLRGVVADISATDGLLLRLRDGRHVHVRAEHARDVRPLPHGTPG